MLSGNENVMCNALQETSWSKPPEVVHALAKALKVKALTVYHPLVSSTTLQQTQSVNFADADLALGTSGVCMCMLCVLGTNKGPKDRILFMPILSVRLLLLRAKQDTMKPPYALASHLAKDSDTEEAC